MKTKLKKYIRKCIPFVLILFIIPCFSMSTYALTYDGYSIIDVLDGASLYNVESFDFNDTNLNNVANAFVSESAFCFLGNKGQTVAKIGNCVIPKQARVLITLTTLEQVTSNGTSTLRVGSDDTISQIQLYLTNINGSTTLRTYNRGNSSFTYYGSRNTVFFNHNTTSELTSFEIVIKNDKTADNPPYEVVRPVYILNVYALPNNVTNDTLNTFMSLVNAHLQKLIDGTLDSNNAVDDFNSVFDDFNSGISNLESFDESVIGEFNSANSSYKTQLNNFTLSSSLLNAGNFLSTSMQTVYDSSSDYKMLWLVPLLFGIPILLFVIRKIGDDK